ncbi:MAG TPA: SBBP repeat-containing protein, partial [Pyrinomonadaceae bacterium]|nr:SBBP repeat-containing protein [Pyrinomonadaceae bacterium]
MHNTANCTNAKRSNIQRSNRRTIYISAIVLLISTVCLFAAAVGAIYEPPSIVSEPSQIAVPSTAQVREAYGRLPLSFEANAGQAHESVDFVARGAGYTLSLSPSGAGLALTRQSDKSPQSAEPSASDSERSGVRARSNRANNTRQSLPRVLRMGIVGGDKSALAVGTDKLPGKVNYFIGRDPRLWRTDVSTFERVRYGNVYPGVDVVYYGNQGQLEYDFVVAPGRDPGVVKLQFKGADKVEVDSAGDLLLTLGESVIRQPKPVVYQEVGGERREVAGGYTVGEDGQVGFRVGEYDRSAPLVIDPVLVYSTYLGGSGTEEGIDIAVDGFGSAYICGDTTSTNFPTANALDGTFGGGQFAGARDAFVTKLNPAGTALVYSTYLGGSGDPINTNLNGDDRCAKIKVDGTGNAYVAGETHSPDFPTANAFQGTYGDGLSDAFVTKLNQAGSALVYSTFIGGNVFDAAHAIALDSSNNAYVVGRTTSSNFPTVNPIQATFAGGSSDVFVLKLNTAGSALVYSTFLGGSDFEAGLSVAVDSSGNAYLTGQGRSTNFPTVNAIQATFGGGAIEGDAFVTKVNAAGSALVYSTYLGGTGEDVGFEIAVDSSGSAHVAGSTFSTNFPTANALQAALSGTSDGFVTKLNAAGSAFAYSTFLGGTGGDSANGIALDSVGTTYVALGTTSTDFPTVNPTQAASGGGTDGAVTKFNAAGSALLYSTYLGGSGSDAALAIALDSAGSMYITGRTTSTNFPTLTPIQSTNGGGTFDVFVTKISDPPATTPTPTPTPTCPQPLNYTVSNTSLVLGGDAFEISGNETSITLTSGTPDDDRFMGGFFIFPGRSTTPPGVYTGTVSQIITFNGGPSTTLSRRIVY